MTEIVTEKTLDEYESVYRIPSEGHFMQSSLWAKQSRTGTGYDHKEG